MLNRGVVLGRKAANLYAPPGSPGWSLTLFNTRCLAYTLAYINRFMLDSSVRHDRGGPVEAKLIFSVAMKLAISNVLGFSTPTIAPWQYWSMFLPNMSEGDFEDLLQQYRAHMQEDKDVDLLDLQPFWEWLL